MEEDSRVIGLDESLGKEIPKALVGTAFERSFVRDRAFHEEQLPTDAHGFLRGLAERAEVIAIGMPSVLYFGGGRITDPRDFQHAVNTSARIAAAHGRTQATTGSGPGTMEAAHLGPTQAINGSARNVGLTLEGLVHKEAPGRHNHELVTLVNMSRRLELFLRLDQAGAIFPGGVGTVEEIGTVLAVLLHPKNRGIHYPFVLSEHARGAGTFMSTVMSALESMFGPEVKRLFSLHQGDTNEGLESLTSLKGAPGGHWNEDLYMPSTSFHPFKLTPHHIAQIDLTNPQDNAVRFAGHLRWFMNLLVQLIMIDREGAYIKEHGVPVVRVSKEVRAALTPVLDMLWAQGRIKTDKRLDELVNLG